MSLERYELVRKLGEGGMGEVYEAVHTLTGRRVAIKKLRPEMLSAPSVLDRFLLEARAACAVQHPNVVEVLDVGVEAGGAFMVLELLEGRSLEDELVEVGRLAPRDLRRLVGPLLDALGAAHDRGILHRDIKPANVFLARRADGLLVPKLLDFGIARFVRSDDMHRVTQTGHLLGTPLYMSPEQARGEKNLDARADLYSFGVLCYEALAGRPPFAEDSLTALLIAITTRDPAPIEGIPSSLDVLVRRTMSRERDARPSTARELREALLSTLDAVAADPTRSAAAPPSSPPGPWSPAGLEATVDAAAAATPSSFAPRTPPVQGNGRRRTVVAWAGVVSALVGGLVLVGALATRSDGESLPPGEVAPQLEEARARDGTEPAPSTTSSTAPAPDTTSSSEMSPATATPEEAFEIPVDVPAASVTPAVRARVPPNDAARRSESGGPSVSAAPPTSATSISSTSTPTTATTDLASASSTSPSTSTPPTAAHPVSASPTTPSTSTPATTMLRVTGERSGELSVDEF